jgi:hypothetical protein
MRLTATALDEKRCVQPGCSSGPQTLICASGGRLSRRCRLPEGQTLQTLLLGLRGSNPVDRPDSRDRLPCLVVKVGDPADASVFLEISFGEIAAAVIEGPAR